MPKLYDYFGVVVLFYSNEHEPIHVHGKCQGREAKAELCIEDGKIVGILFSSVKGRRPLRESELRDFQRVTEYYAYEIVQKWVDYFVLHKPVRAQTITQRIR